MAQLFATSDEHFGHFNILKYCQRPFKTIEQMNETIIKNHNERIKKEDTCLIVGDFCFKNSPNGKEGEGMPIHSKNYIERLNGNLVFVRGNHDRNNSVQTKIERLVLKVGGIYINVCHNPQDAIIEDSHYYSLNLVGHVHTSWKTKEISKNGKFSLMINVGVDLNSFRPYNFDELKAIYDQWYTKHPARKSINKLIISKG